MEKIFNNPKLNVYGGISMKNKFIYFNRKYSDYIEHYIFKINDILKDKYPIKYKVEKAYKFILYSDFNKEAYLRDNIKELDLTNYDELYEITISEFLEYFKLFIDYDCKPCKEFPLDMIKTRI